MSQQATRTWKMAWHQSLTVVGAASSSLAAGMLGHVNTLNAHDLPVAENATQVLGFALMASIACWIIVYKTRPIAKKVPTNTPGTGTIYT